MKLLECCDKFTFLQAASLLPKPRKEQKQTNKQKPKQNPTNKKTICEEVEVATPTGSRELEGSNKHLFSLS